LTGTVHRYRDIQKHCLSEKHNHLSIHQRTHSPIYPSTNALIHPSIHPPTHSFTHLSIHQCTHSPIYPSTNALIHPSIHPPMHSLHPCLLHPPPGSWALTLQTPHLLLGIEPMAAGEQSLGLVFTCSQKETETISWQGQQPARQAASTQAF
jgi:hypothetical protein